ncbi:MAG: hypothetical protein LBU23_02260 [Planctomycetota bacterium]|jgi:hypothetical protein|nr:hypothetical protein [Planctomycetota bacterium]
MTTKKAPKQGRKALGNGLAELAGTEAGKETPALIAAPTVDHYQDQSVILLDRLTRKPFRETIGDYDALHAALVALADLRTTLIAAAKARLDEDSRLAETRRREAMDELSDLEEACR